MSDMIRVGEVARMLGISTREVLRLIDSGQLGHGRDDRRQLVVPAGDVERLRGVIS